MVDGDSDVREQQRRQIRSSSRYDVSHLTPCSLEVFSAQTLYTEKFLYYLCTSQQLRVSVLGLGEVLCAMGTNRLEKLMPEVISTTERVDLAPHVREGYLMLYIYLPSTFKDDFIPFVGPVIPSVLKVTSIVSFSLLLCVYRACEMMLLNQFIKLNDISFIKDNYS